MRKLIVVLMVVGLVASAQANLLTNGGFNADPTATGGGWTLISGSSSNYRWSDVPTVSVGNPDPGIRLATTNGALQGILAQTIAVTPNTDYGFGFDSDFYGTGFYDLYINVKMQIATTAGDVIATAMRSGYNDWVTTTGSFNSGANTAVVAKLISTDYDWEPEAYYDNAYVVPEPATMALLGLGSLAMLRRRKLKVKS